VKNFIGMGLFLFSVSMAAGSAAAPLRLPVAAFSDTGLAGWETREFKGRTRYRLVSLEGRRVLRADVRGTASGLFRKIEIDLERTPWLHWSWRVDNIYQGVDEQQKSGDDYPARIYVVDSGGLLFWNTRALNYVWSSTMPAGRAWPSAFTSNAMLLAVESGSGHTGQWRHYRRNVREDFKRLFGADVNRIEAVALMTDADNAGQAATAYYGDIYFSATAD